MIIHLPSRLSKINALSLLAFLTALIHDMAWLFGSTGARKPAGYGLGLAGIYAVLLVIIVALYPACRWFASLNRRRGEWWWSYLLMRGVANLGLAH